MPWTMQARAKGEVTCKILHNIKKLFPKTLSKKQVWAGADVSWVARRTARVTKAVHSATDKAPARIVDRAEVKVAAVALGVAGLNAGVVPGETVHAAGAHKILLTRCLSHQVC